MSREQFFFCLSKLFRRRKIFDILISKRILNKIALYKILARCGFWPVFVVLLRLFQFGIWKSTNLRDDQNKHFGDMNF